MLVTSPEGKKGLGGRTPYMCVRAFYTYTKFGSPRVIFKPSVMPECFNFNNVLKSGEWLQTFYMEPVCAGVGVCIRVECVRV